MTFPWEAVLADRTERMTSSAIRELLKLTQQPGVISFAGGMPAPETFPIEEFIRASEAVLSEAGPRALQYSPTEGFPPLRKLIVDWMADLGVNLTIDNILITTGSLQVLDLVGKLFLNPNDRIVVEAPTFLGALQAWNAYQAAYLPIPVDPDGMVTDDLEIALTQKPKFIYALPNFQNPTGVTLSQGRRRALVALAKRYQVPIIEDDPYGKLRYEGRPLPSLMSMAQESNPAEEYQGHVIYTSTFSKILSPGIRLAWAAGPVPIIRRMVQAKQGTDLHTPILIQMIAYEIARHGMNKHIEGIIQTYRQRRDVMLTALHENFPAKVKWTNPEGGLFLWVTLPESMDSRAFLEAAVLQKVAFVPGGAFFTNGGGHNTMRLNFSNAKSEQILIGIQRLGKLLHSQ